MLGIFTKKETILVDSGFLQNKPGPLNPKDSNPVNCKTTPVK